MLSAFVSLILIDTYNINLPQIQLRQDRFRAKLRLPGPGRANRQGIKSVTPSEQMVNFCDIQSRQRVVVAMRLDCLRP